MTFELGYESKFQRAINSLRAGNYEGAELLLKQLVSSFQNNFDVMHALAISCAGQNKHGEAIKFYREALKCEPRDISMLSNMASSLNAMHQNFEAISLLNKALEIDSNQEEIWYNAGNVLSDLGQFKDAITYYERAIHLNPEYIEAYSNYGKALFDLGSYEQSLSCYEKALSINGLFIEALINKGVVLNQLKRHNEALDICSLVIDHAPEFPGAWLNKGISLNELKRYDEAISHYEKALSLQSDNWQAWLNKGISLNELKRYDEAITHYEKALSLQSDRGQAWLPGELMHLKMKVCNWTGFEENLSRLIQQVNSGCKVVQPFPMLALVDDAALHMKCVQLYANEEYPSNNCLGPLVKNHKPKKIRIGYFSADFHNHATGHLMAEIFELHNKDKFEIVAFSFGPIQYDDVRNRLMRAFDQFYEMNGLADIEIARFSRNMQIDIAIDLKGFTQYSRPGIFAYRAAPLQVNYLGYPGTLGVNYVDYLIADEILIPEESKRYYSEKIAYMPTSYQPNDRKRVISTQKFNRNELGLPKQGFIFCCFNNNYKILPSIFQGWMRILKAVEGSVLWLLEDNKFSAQNLRNEAWKNGIDGERLIFAKRMPTAEHLARHKLADLFLDTSPYNAHTTCSDALWAGLPVITLKGDTFASRVASSLLGHMNLTELIAMSQSEYEALAINLAKNPVRLAAVRQKLTNELQGASLFDTPYYVEKLESIYAEIYRRYQAKLPPDDISVGFDLN